MKSTIAHFMMAGFAVLTTLPLLAPAGDPPVVQIAKLRADDGAAEDVFGTSVSISGDTVIVGAPFDDDQGLNSGSAYLFGRNQGGANNWDQITKLSLNDGEVGDEFGIAVSISGERALVGAHFDDDQGEESGSAYVFGRNQGGADNWGQIAKFTPDDGATDNRFGAAVALADNFALVGAFQDDDLGMDSGSAYVFQLADGSSNEIFRDDFEN